MWSMILLYSLALRQTSTIFTQFLCSISVRNYCIQYSDHLQLRILQLKLLYPNSYSWFNPQPTVYTSPSQIKNPFVGVFLTLSLFSEMLALTNRVFQFLLNHRLVLESSCYGVFNSDLPSFYLIWGFVFSIDLRSEMKSLRLNRLFSISLLILQLSFPNGPQRTFLRMFIHLLAEFMLPQFYSAGGVRTSSHDHRCSASFALAAILPTMYTTIFLFNCRLHWGHSWLSRA